MKCKLNAQAQLVCIAVKSCYRQILRIINIGQSPLVIWEAQPVYVSEFLRSQGMNENAAMLPASPCHPIKNTMDCLIQVTIMVHHIYELILFYLFIYLFVPSSRDNGQVLVHMSHQSLQRSRWLCKFSS